ncbi:unnamed protein product [Protopolystoma xenopodis]|uniref:Uncharacterized protein n=1 Tax=Protopolystoma xenopodis TaxID=117903 RepID=A0A3S5A6I8_9PLAT|nr:unnamed protein product [Protopolystoma xenopodis]
MRLDFSHLPGELSSRPGDCDITCTDERREMGIDEMAAALEREAIFHDLMGTSPSSVDVAAEDASMSSMLQAASLSERREVND